MATESSSKFLKLPEHPVVVISTLVFAGLGAVWSVVSMWDWWKKPSPGLSAEVFYTSFRLPPPIRPAADSITRRAKLAPVKGMWETAIRNSGDQVAERVFFVLPGASSVCVSRPNMPEQCGAPDLLRNIGAVPSGEVVYVTAWTPSFEPDYFSPSDVQLTHANGRGTVTLLGMNPRTRRIVAAVDGRIRTASAESVFFARKWRLQGATLVFGGLALSGLLVGVVRTRYRR